MMKHASLTGLLAGLLALPLAATAKLTPEQAAKLPPPATRKVDFIKDIQPILEASCIKCHGRGQAKGGFRMDTRETFLAAADSGPAAIPGKSAESYLIELVMGFDPDTVMPQKGSKLKPDQIALLRAWIDQGLPWDASVSFGKIPHKNLKPQKPALPAAAVTGKANPVDALLEPYYRSKKFTPPKPVEDRLFARRVYLDIVGMLPTPNELNEFLGDKRADKRQQLVVKLLADNRRYAEHWLSFWNDLLRNDYKGTGYIDGGRKQITMWLYSSLATNVPYDKFVAQLIAPTPDCDGFTKGIVWRGTVNASQVPPMQAAQNVSQVFMGVNLKCASCHDSFINDWTLADSYALANIYSDEPMELFKCDKPTGKKAGTGFIYSELGQVDGKAAKAERLKQLANVITSKQNGRLSRTVVNRLWQRFMGHGLVEPADEMDTGGAWSPEVLDWLAEDLVEHNWNLKRTMEMILTSRAYQLPAVNLGDGAVKDYAFTGPAVRRMSAEQFRDALTSVGGLGYAKPDAQVDWSAGGVKTKPAALGIPPKWIWNTGNAATKAKAETVYFRAVRVFNTEPTDSRIAVAADNSFTLYVNGKEAGKGKDFSTPSVFTVKLKKGTNVIAIAAVNNLPGDIAPTPETAVAGTENPAGLIVYARVRAKNENLDFASDTLWRTSRTKSEGWTEANFDDSAWIDAIGLGNVDDGPWNLGDKLAATFGPTAPRDTVRASLVAADALQLALGRPNREQVATVRQSNPTTLQALELTNGNTLADLLKRSAAKIAADSQQTPSQLVNRLYVQGIGRVPSAKELALAEEVIGKPVKAEGVEDLLWGLAMLPEFQLIY